MAGQLSCSNALTNFDFTKGHETSAITAKAVGRELCRTFSGDDSELARFQASVNEIGPTVLTKAVESVRNSSWVTCFGARFDVVYDGWGCKVEADIGTELLDIVEVCRWGSGDHEITRQLIESK